MGTPLSKTVEVAIAVEELVGAATAVAATARITDKIIIAGSGGSKNVTISSPTIPALLLCVVIGEISAFIDLSNRLFSPSSTY